MGVWQDFLASLGLGPKPGATPQPAASRAAAPAPKAMVIKPVAAPPTPGLERSEAYDVYVTNLESFFGRPVQDFESPGDIADFALVAPRIQTEYDGDPLEARLQLLLAQPGIEDCEALVIGAWNVESDDSPQPLIDLLVAERRRLPALRAIFFGDITSEQNEMSWIVQGDYSAFWAAFPTLEAFHARGAQELKLGRIRHERLQTLVIETGGMPAELAREAVAAQAPLNHLELWLGTDDYGGTTTAADLRPLLDGAVFPDLAYLGLCNAENQDDIAAAVATSKIVGRLTTLDLSKGILRDAGGQALVAGGGLGTLETLVISHHYMDAPTVLALKAAVPTLVQSPSDPQQPDAWENEVYYNIAVAE